MNDKSCALQCSAAIMSRSIAVGPSFVPACLYPRRFLNSSCMYTDSLNDLVISTLVYLPCARYLRPQFSLRLYSSSHR